jgi:hypothetical protein
MVVGAAFAMLNDAVRWWCCSPSQEKKKPLTLVYFIGGVTFAEISALRFLSEREGHGMRL